MKVRRAEPGDADAIAALLGQLGYPVEPDQCRRRLDRLPQSTSVFVTEELSGLAALDVRHVLQSDAPRAQIVALVVREDARGRGIARALVGAIEEAARVSGAGRLVVISGHHRADAHAAYRALGFADSGIRFYKEL